jgi:hypothetical protein
MILINESKSVAGGGLGVLAGVAGGRCEAAKQNRQTASLPSLNSIGAIRVTSCPSVIENVFAV